MLEIMPYEYWANLALRTYLDSSADLLLVPLIDYDDGIKYVNNRGLYGYLEQMVRVHQSLYDGLPNYSDDSIMRYFKLLKENPNWYPSRDFMIKEIYWFELPYLSPEDIMSESNWIFQVLDETNTAVEEVEDIMSEANWMFEEE